MIGGPGDSERHIRKKTGPVGFNEDSLAYGRTKQSFTGAVGLYLNKAVSFIKNPRQYVRDHNKFLRFIRGEWKDGENAQTVAKALRERKVAAHFSLEDIQLGIKKANIRALEDQNLPYNKEQRLQYEVDRTRAVRIKEGKGDLKEQTGQVWSAGEEKLNTAEIQKKMEREYDSRDARGGGVKSGVRQSVWCGKPGSAAVEKTCEGAANSGCKVE